ncbi:MAG: hypothetical protein IKP88_17195 [Lachnospiraceae bacterium]|nr:hypothetical protein [Lachnospiraceae bacterium]
MKGGNGGLAVALGVVGIVISILGGICFGIFGALLGIASSVGGIILGINTQKATNGAQGKGGLVCGIIGAAFGVLFFIGCLACDVGGYGKFGCVGGCNSAVNDAKNSDADFEKAWNELEKAVKDATK